MGEFFRGWKRKAGVLTLMLACVSAIGWARSLMVIQDVITIPGNKFRSSRGQLVWEGKPVFDKLTGSDDYGISFESFHNRMDLSEERISQRDCRWHWCGFSAGEDMYLVYSGNGRIKFWRARYWSVVIPLTLMSACLLLSKPRQRRATIDPAPAKAGY